MNARSTATAQKQWTYYGPGFSTCNAENKPMPKLKTGADKWAPAIDPNESEPIIFRKVG